MKYINKIAISFALFYLSNSCFSADFSDDFSEYVKGDCASKYKDQIEIKKCNDTNAFIGLTTTAFLQSNFAYTNPSAFSKTIEKPMSMFTRNPDKLRLRSDYVTKKIGSYRFPVLVLMGEFLYFINSDSSRSHEDEVKSAVSNLTHLIQENELQDLSSHKEKPKDILRYKVQN